MTPFGVRQFRRLLAGCVAISLVTFLLSSLGTVLTGHFLGETALTGVALASPLFTLCGFLTALIGAGTGINYSLRRGRLDRDGADSVFMQGVWSALFCGIVVALATWFFRDAFIGLLTSDPDIARSAVAYWRWLPPGLAFMCFSCVLFNCCYCDGDTFYATAVTCVHCLVSLGVSCLALRLGYGEASCSLGFFVGYLFACVALAFHFLRRGNTFRFGWRFSFRDILTIVQTSAGDATGFLGDAVVYVVLGWILSRRFGPEALLGLPVFVFVSEALGYVNGFASAMQPIVAVYFGECNYLAVRRTVRNIFLTLAAVSSAVTLALLVLPRIVLVVLGVDDPSMAFIVRAAALIVLPFTAVNLLNNYYQLVGREHLALGLTVFYWIVLPLSVLLLFPLFGERGFWYWGAATRWGGVVLFALYLLVRYGARRFPLLLDREREAAIETFDLRLTEIEIATTAEGVSRRMLDFGVKRERALRARLLVEESLMVIKERNAGRPVFAEVTLDLNDGIVLTLRDDGVIFDITDADARVSGLRTYLVATMMQHQSEKSNILTTGFNRNVFRL